MSYELNFDGTKKLFTSTVENHKDEINKNMYKNVYIDLFITGGKLFVDTFDKICVELNFNVTDKPFEIKNNQITWKFN